MEINKVFGMKVSALAQTMPSYFKFKKFRDNQILGAEFEVEFNGFDYPMQADFPSYWSVLEDHSLRNGMEYITKTPVSPKYFKANSWPYFKKRIGTKSPIEMSYRCSTHIHLSAHALYVYQAIMMAVMYYIYEDVLTPVYGDNRRGNLFCVGANNAQEHTVGELIRLLKSDGMRSLLKFLSDRGTKYSAVNLQTLMRLGTVEFRAMEGTVDEDRVFLWIDILTAIREFCLNTTPEQMPRVLDDLSATGAIEFTRRVFGEAVTDKLMANYNDPGEFEMAVFEGIWRVQSFFYDVPWHTLKLETEVEEVPTAKKQKTLEQIMAEM